MKNKILNILLFLLSIIAVVIIVIIILKYNERNENETQLKEVVSEINEDIQENQNEEIPYVEYKGYQVIGIIKIEKINIEYPILIECTSESMNISVARFGNGKVNEEGNLCIAGHNYLNGTMFGKLNKLEIGDEISVLDLYGNTVNYTVFDRYITNPNDTSVLESTNEDKKEITLITCINGNKNRLIIKATN